MKKGFPASMVALVAVQAAGLPGMLGRPVLDELNSENLPAVQWMSLAAGDVDLSFSHGSEEAYGIIGPIYTGWRGPDGLELRFEEYYKEGVYREFRASTDLQTWDSVQPKFLIKEIPRSGRQSLVAVMSAEGERNFFRLRYTSNLNPPVLDPVYVRIDLDHARDVGGFRNFDRRKYITLHASHTEQEWQDGVRNADNFVDNLLEDFMVGRDVYFGRNSGMITWNLNNRITEDPSRTGWADPASISQWGNSVRAAYEKNTAIHPYESRSDEVLVAQFHPFWPDGTQTNKGWSFSRTDTMAEPFGTAVGDFMGRFMNAFYNVDGTQGGQPVSPYVEVINEPEWMLLDNPTDPPTDPDLIWRFHKGVADRMRTHNSDALIGGYTTTFPDLDKNSFQEWNNEWKAFIDIAGSSMDFWSIHIYDWPARNIYRRGAYMEAMFDMIDYYSEATLGLRRPYVISEYGAQAGWQLVNDDWSSWRDWLKIQSSNGMLMGLLERPHLMLKTIPFIVVKGEWGRDPVNGYPYSSRLMRQSGEPDSYTGEWVYTDMVHFYDLWAQVDGLRLDTRTTDIDIQADAYAEGEKLHLILNNLIKNPGNGTRRIQLDPVGKDDNPVQSMKVRHLHWNGNRVTLDESTHQGELAAVDIASEAAVIIEYTFTHPIQPAKTIVEDKHFANGYLKPIQAGTPVDLEVSGVNTAGLDRAVLRIGLGRSQPSSKKPQVLFNGTELTVPFNILGYDGDSRADFFGILQVPVPVELVQSQNSISVTFPDTGGHLSTLALRTFSKHNAGQ